MEDRYKKFYKQMWATKCARFTAHARLESLAARADTAILLLSIAVVALSLFKAAAFFDLSDKAQKAGDIALVGLSALLLLGECHVKGKKYRETANKFHQSGVEIAKIYDSYVFEVEKAAPDDKLVGAYIHAYHDALYKYGINHGFVDLQRVMAQHPADYGISGWKVPFYRAYVWGRTFLRSGGSYVAASLLFSGIAVFFIYSYAFR